MAQPNEEPYTAIEYPLALYHSIAPSLEAEGDIV